MLVKFIIIGKYDIFPLYEGEVCAIKHNPKEDYQAHGNK